MTDRFLIVAFGTSLLIHLGLLPILALLPQMQSKVPTTIPIELVDAPKIAKIRNTEIAPPAPKRAAKLPKIVAPKLLSKPTIFETPPTTPIGNTKQDIKEPEKLPVDTTHTRSAAGKCRFSKSWVEPWQQVARRGRRRGRCGKSVWPRRCRSCRRPRCRRRRWRHGCIRAGSWQ